jgi:hypothetical protein
MSMATASVATARNVMTKILVTVVVLATTLGVAGGYLLGQSQSEPCEQASDQAPTASKPAIVHRVVHRYEDTCECPEQPGDAGLQDAYDWCLQQLLQCEQRANFGREEWPDDSPLELPDRWTTLVAEALEQCDVPLSMRVAECSEYPCVAVLPTGRTSTASEQDRAAIEAAQREVAAKLHDCPILRSELRAEQLDDLVHVFHYDVGCEIVLGVIMAPPESALTETLQGEDFDRQLRWYYRRGEDIASAWECGS